MTKKTIPFPGNIPISKAVIHDKKYTMELSGQIGINPETKKLEEGIENQTARTLENIKKLLEDQGWILEDIIKTRVYLVDMKDYQKMNEIYSNFFTKDYPTRITLAVKELPLGALVEIECTAARDKLKE